MEITFKKQSFKNKMKSMLKVDFKRMFTTPLIYIMVGVSFVMPILILVMTSMMSGVRVDPVTGAETTIEGFTNVWQAIGSVSGNASMISMDLTSMCNINMLYFLIPVLVCIFIGDDFRSGYCKNLFTVRSKKIDYVISKTSVGFVGAVMMLVVYFVGAMLGGAIAGLSFDLGSATIGGIFMCMVSKIFLSLVFVSISVAMSVFAKTRLWLSILCSFAFGALLFTMIPLITPLNSTFVNVIMCFVGGSLFAVGIGALSNLILNKTSIVN